MKIGIIKETAQFESRVAMVPATVKRLAKLGAECLIEKGAGDAAHFSNAEYEQAGATVVDQAKALQADAVVSITRPSAELIGGMRKDALFVGMLAMCGDDELVEQANAAGVRLLAMERIPRISRAQSMDALSSQANIAGYRAVLEAANHYGRFMPLMMTSAGSAKPAKVYVLGAGVAGLQAIATARRLGAEVWGYDVRPEVAEQVESLGAKFLELELEGSGSGEGGYAKELSDEDKARQQQALADALKAADVVVSTALIPCRPAPTLITEDTIKGMRDGSVVIDLAAANGGNCPLTKANEVVKINGVTIVGHTNYPSMMASDSSSFYAGNIYNLIQLMTEKDGDKLVMQDLAADEVTQTAWVNAPATEGEE